MHLMHVLSFTLVHNSHLVHTLLIHILIYLLL